MAVSRELHGNREYPLHGKVTITGRDQGCGIVIGGEQVSRQHAVLVHAGGAYHIQDLDSGKNYFLKSDIDEFKRYRTQLDETLQQGNLQPGFDISTATKSASPSVWIMQ